MGDLPFFRAQSLDDPIVASIDLAIFYRCDPFTFLERPQNEVMELYRLTKDRIGQVQRDES